MNLNLVPPHTRVNSSGNGERFDVSASATRTFMCTLEIDDQIEQESIDMSIYVSSDGDTWPAKPFLMLPQQFYKGRTRLLLDLTPHPGVRYIRAHWVLNRRGRVAPTPMFVISFSLEEIPASQPLVARS
jgi:hypothetical protein